jgi:hypothetical protein
MARFAFDVSNMGHVVQIENVGVEMRAVDTVTLSRRKQCVRGACWSGAYHALSVHGRI